MTSSHATRSRRRRSNSSALVGIVRRSVWVDALEGRVLMAAKSGTIDFAATKQTIDGLGAAPIIINQPSEYATSAFYDQLINDLGASGARAPVPADFETENDNDDPNTFDWSKFDSSKLAPSMNFLKALSERGATNFFATVWTPPYWMKTNHAVAGGGSLRYDMRDEFAEFVAAVVIAAKRDFNVQLAGISVQNEQFFVEPYESAVADAPMLRETVLAVQKKFKTLGLTTKVIANEDLGDQDAGRWSWFNQPLLENDEIDRSNLIIGSHKSIAAAMTTQANQLAGTGIPLWYTETSGDGPDWTSGLVTAVEASDIFTKANASSYNYYFFDNDPVTAYESGDHVGRYSLMSNGVPNGKYHALKHFYRYVRPGMQRVATTIDETGGTRLSAFKDPKTGDSTIVLINLSGASTDYTLNLSHLGKNASYDVYRSNETSQWVSGGKLTGSGAVTITLGGYSMVTLHDGAELTPVTGSAGTAIAAPRPRDMTSGPTTAGYLREYAYNGELAKVQQVLSWAPQLVNAADAHGWTALHAAAASVYNTWHGGGQQVAVIDALIAAGANVNARTDDGLTPLHVAAMNQFLEWSSSMDFQMKAKMAEKFVAAGADVNAVDDEGRTALHWSALTPASSDTYSLNLNLPWKLLSLGADKGAVDAAGHTAYDYAMQEYKGSFLSTLAGTGLDKAAPRARFAKYLVERNEVSFTFTEDVTATLSAADVQLMNLTTNTPVASSAFTMAKPNFSMGLSFAHVKFAGRLPDGKYRLTIPAGTFADQSGVVSSEPVVVTFTVLRGDADGNGTVNFSDLLILAKNYNKAPAAGSLWASGDFDGNGVVDFSDLLTLAKNYNKTL